MTTYSTETYILEMNRMLYAPKSGDVARETQRVKLSEDSIESLASSLHEAKGRVNVGARAALPPPKESAAPDALAIMAEEFAKAFSAMKNGVITENVDYVSLQELDQTQTQAVLASTTNAINKQEAAMKIADEIAQYQKEMGAAAEIFGWVMMGLGVALMAATAIAGFICPAVDAALPEEAELLDFAAGDIAADAAADSTSFVGEEGSIELADLSSSGIDTSTVNAGENLANGMSKTAASAARSSWDIGTMIGKYLFKAAIGAGFASPMLMTGIAKLKVAEKSTELSKAQTAVGDALDLQQRNNMYFRFLQQMVQREGGVLEEEVNDSSEIIDTFASVANAYRTITYGLANAV